MSTIVIFDSGVGGLSVYQEVSKACPNHNYIFVSDNQAFPYGTKQDGELIGRVVDVVSCINQQYKPDLLVVACNTASTLALPELRKRHAFPIVGVVPAIKPAAILSKSKTIGLLGTPATIKRAYTEELIERFASDCMVVRVGSTELVEVAERKLYGASFDSNIVAAQLKPFLAYPELDVLVLACTHFPLLNNEISSIINVNNNFVTLIDSGVAIANRVTDIIEPPRSLVTQTQSSAVFTAEVTSNRFYDVLASLGFQDIHVITV